MPPPFSLSPYFSNAFLRRLLHLPETVNLFPQKRANNEFSKRERKEKEGALEMEEIRKIGKQ